ncbi:hypothetical protein QVD17_19190 [Tagetes erecta]|uniref:Uncharacterized protein n=1 Tax=Tagetes erecta TaxID=13708 RepID=A0AAD8KMK1_TARER|nr:hypothetical protein QVD17_19190 [Tagetes erecta]
MTPISNSSLHYPTPASSSPSESMEMMVCDGDGGEVSLRRIGSRNVHQLPEAWRTPASTDDDDGGSGGGDVSVVEGGF